MNDLLVLTQYAEWAGRLRGYLKGIQEEATFAKDALPEAKDRAIQRIIADVEKALSYAPDKGVTK